MVSTGINLMREVFVLIYRLILPKHAEGLGKRPVLEGVFDADQISKYNAQGYNIYWLRNYPSNYERGTTVEGYQVDTFEYVFADFDLKDGKYESKDAFIASVTESGIEPTEIVDSGGGVHVYWRVLDLDAMSFLRLTRRIIRRFDTDDSIATVYRLMRAPGTFNTKLEGNPRLCEYVYKGDKEYTCEELDKLLPPISIEDEEYCQRHYDMTFNPDKVSAASEELPPKWFKFAKKGTEAYNLFYNQQKNRSAADFRLGHLLAGEGFTRDEAVSVLCNSAKASERSTVHRMNYAINIVDKIWEAVETINPDKLGYTIDELLDDSDMEEFEGTPFRCHPLFDATACGFRLTHVLGLVGGAGSGKTATSLNYFYHFAKRNPEYVHVVFTLEQPKKEIAKRWRKIAGNNPLLNRTVIIVDNYTAEGSFRNLSLDDCEAYVASLQAAGTKVGCVMIDHIGILKKSTKNGEREGLIDICQRMKSVAVNRNIMLIMQSQTSRDKAKGGDMELDKDAAYGTTNFEWFVDWLVTIWQPLKRVYKEAPHMTITCFKYCKIRHKSSKDDILEDVVYALKFDPETGLLRKLNSEEKEVYDFYAKRAAAERNRDRSEDPGAVSDITWNVEEKTNGTKINHASN